MEAPQKAFRPLRNLVSAHNPHIRKALSSFLVTCAMVNHKGSAKNQHQMLTNIARIATAMTIPISGNMGTPMRVGTRVHPLKRGKAWGRKAILLPQKHRGNLSGRAYNNQANRPSHKSLFLDGVEGITNAKAN